MLYRFALILIILNTISLFKCNSATVTEKSERIDPCAELDILKNPGSQFLKQLSDERTYGYAQDIPLSDAIARFNRVAGCNEVGRTQPPLTEAELLAAVRDESTYEGTLSDISKSKFRRISNEKLLPKGMFLTFEPGRLNQENGFSVTCWRIILMTELDKYPLLPRDEEVNDGKVREFVVRKQCISSWPDSNEWPPERKM